MLSSRLAAELSQTNRLAGVTTPSSAAAMVSVVLLGPGGPGCAGGWRY